MVVVKKLFLVLVFHFVDIGRSYLIFEDNLQTARIHINMETNWKAAQVIILRKIHVNLQEQNVSGWNN